MDIYIPQEHEIGGCGLESKCLLWWLSNAFHGLDHSAQLTIEEMTRCYTASSESPKAAMLRALAQELGIQLREEHGQVHAAGVGFQSDASQPAERVRAYRAAVERCGHTPK